MDITNITRELCCSAQHERFHVLVHLQCCYSPTCSSFRFFPAMTCAQDNLRVGSYPVPPEAGAKREESQKQKSPHITQDHSRSLKDIIQDQSHLFVEKLELCQAYIWWQNRSQAVFLSLGQFGVLSKTSASVCFCKFWQGSRRRDQADLFSLSAEDHVAMVTSSVLNIQHHSASFSIIQHHSAVFSLLC